MNDRVGWEETGRFWQATSRRRPRATLQTRNRVLVPMTRQLKAFGLYVLSYEIAGLGCRFPEVSNRVILNHRIY